jgi:hypothetical protein
MSARGPQPIGSLDRPVVMRRPAVIVLIAALVAACTSPPAPPVNGPDPSAIPLPSAAAVAPSGSAMANVYLPTYRPMDSVPEAEIGGTLVEDDGCLWLEHAEGRALPLWPPGSRIEQDGNRLLVRNSGGARAEVVGGGGGYGPEKYDFVVELIGEEIPESCGGDGFYWLVYGVRPANE